MRKLNVKHYPNIYHSRVRMQENGITNPPKEIKELTKSIVDRLLKFPLDEIITLECQLIQDSEGNIIVEFSKL